MRHLVSIAIFSLLLLSAPSTAQDERGVSLPDEGPIPQESPETAVPALEEMPAAETLPDDDPPAPDEPVSNDLPRSETAPVPSPRPRRGAMGGPPEPEISDEPEPERPARAGVMPQEERACRRQLRDLGVAFAEHPPQSEPSGCEMPHPLVVSSLGGGVALEPEVVINCAAAEANARFLRDHAQRAAHRHLSARIVMVNQVSGYVCRPRAGTATLSEHAFGNALDWGAVVLDDERRIEVRAYRRGSPEATFFAAIRKTACGPFKTVLGPGSDADHADHLHFDLAERSNGSTYCR